MKKVSIIIPCHNDGQYLPEALACAFAQTWENKEIIIIDDGSADEATLKLLDDLRQDSRVTVLRHEQAKGPSAARNTAIRAGKGEYIMPLDADDKIEPDYIAKAAAVLDSRPEVGAVYAHGDYFGEVTGPMKLKDYNLRDMLVDNVVFVSALIRRSAFEQAGLYDEAFRTGLEDYDGFLGLLEHGWEIVQLPETLFYCRVKPVSRTTKMVDDTEKYRATYQMLYDKHKQLYLDNLDLVFPALKEAFVA
ncbi:MAG: glycosyltransferase family A protein [Clostridia bacterium]|nr:glycosyltransferase family A protein [Clostridia bacterium]